MTEILADFDEEKIQDQAKLNDRLFRWHIFREEDKEDLIKFVSVAIYGSQSVQKYKKNVDTITKKLEWHQNKVTVAFTFLTCKGDKGYFIYGLLRQLTNSNTIIFIDRNTRVYRGWEDFVKNNKLPKCYYLSPINGVHTFGENIMKYKSAELYSKKGQCLFRANTCLFTASGLALLASPVVASAAVIGSGVFYGYTSIQDIKDSLDHSCGINFDILVKCLLSFQDLFIGGAKLFEIIPKAKLALQFGRLSTGCGTAVLIIEGANIYLKFREGALSIQDFSYIAHAVFMLYAVSVTQSDISTISTINLRNLTNADQISGKILHTMILLAREKFPKVYRLFSTLIDLKSDLGQIKNNPSAMLNIINHSKNLGIILKDATKEFRKKLRETFDSCFNHEFSNGTERCITYSMSSLLTSLISLNESFSSQTFSSISQNENYNEASVMILSAIESIDGVENINSEDDYIRELKLLTDQILNYRKSLNSVLKNKRLRSTIENLPSDLIDAFCRRTHNKKPSFHFASNSVPRSLGKKLFTVFQSTIEASGRQFNSLSFEETAAIFQAILRAHDKYSVDPVITMRVEQMYYEIKFNLPSNEDRSLDNEFVNNAFLNLYCRFYAHLSKNIDLSNSTSIKLVNFLLTEFRNRYNEAVGLNEKQIVRRQFNDQILCDQIYEILLRENFTEAFLEVHDSLIVESSVSQLCSEFKNRLHLYTDEEISSFNFSDYGFDIRILTFKRYSSDRDFIDLAKHLFGVQVESVSRIETNCVYASTQHENLIFHHHPNDDDLVIAVRIKR